MNQKLNRNWQLVVFIIVVAGTMALALSGYLNPLVKAAISPFIGVSGWISTRYTAIVEFVTVPKDSASLRERNVELEAEVAQLQTQVIELQQQMNEARILYSLLDFAQNRPENVYVAASVIGRDPSPFLQYLILDQGSDSGIRRGMPVVNQQGLVGRIDAVTANASRVQLITDPGSSVNVHLRNANTNTVLTGSLTGDVVIELLPADLSITAGDLIITSGLGGNYPSDIVVGQIISVRKAENTLFQEASVQPAADFTNLQAVLVITNFKPVDTSPLIPTTAP
jgi:rod shape-determining protein MreC